MTEYPRHPSVASSTLVELTTRLDFFKERRSQLMEQLHNLDLNYGSTTSQDFVYKPSSPSWSWLAKLVLHRIIHVEEEFWLTCCISFDSLHIFVSLCGPCTVLFSPLLFNFFPLFHLLVKGHWSWNEKLSFCSSGFSLLSLYEFLCFFREGGVEFVVIICHVYSWGILLDKTNTMRKFYFRFGKFFVYRVMHKPLYVTYVEITVMLFLYI